MANEPNPSRRVMTPPFRMSYPNLAKARAYKDKQGDPKFNTQMIFTAEDLDNFYVADDTAEKGFRKMKIVDILVEIARERWPGKSIKDTLAAKGGWPLRNGDAMKLAMEEKGKKGDHYEGMTVMSAKASEEFPPQLRYRVNGKLETLDRDNPADKSKIDKLFQGGNYARAELNIKTNDVPDNYVTAYLNQIVFVKMGEKLGTGSVMDRFDGIYGGEADFDPTEGMSNDSDVPY